MQTRNPYVEIIGGEEQTATSQLLSAAHAGAEMMGYRTAVRSNRARRIALHFFEVEKL